MHKRQAIVGHTTSDSARLWVLGLPGDTRVEVFAAGRLFGKNLEAGPRPYAVVSIEGLAPESEYPVELRFSSGASLLQNIRTFAREAPSVRFLLGSCNFFGSMGWVDRIRHFGREMRSPFARLADLAREHGDLRFMIHCGDQIYGDLAFTSGMYENYYLGAFNEDEAARTFLSMMPQYMILDDHEVANNFTKDSRILSRAAAMAAYHKYQHSRNPATPDGQLDYSFDCAFTSFFVMNTRTERSVKASQMVSTDQLARLVDWLRRSEGRCRFIVTSVPFLAETREESEDKWCGEPFAMQRLSILRAIDESRGPRPVFLTGDMHGSYCASKSAGSGPLFEIMSSPLAQVEHAKRSDYRSNIQFMRFWERNNFVVEVEAKVRSAGGYDIAATCHATDTGGFLPDKVEFSV